jgi:hypothetical protein
MNIRTPVAALRTADDVLDWHEGREGRRELVDARVIESLRHTSCSSQDEARIWIWHREDGGFQGLDILVEGGTTLTLSAFDARIALADLYRDVA